MAIKAKKMVVGANEIPQQPAKEALNDRITAKKIVVIKEPVIVKETKLKKESITKKYDKKEDGLLIRKINTKSSYMRDVFGLDSE